MSEKEGEGCVAARSAPRCDEPPTPLPRLPPALQWQNSYHSDNQWVRRSAAARKGGAVRAQTCRFDGDREAVRRQSVIRALKGVLELAAGG